MRAVPFTARWQAEAVVGGCFEASWVLEDQTLFAGHYPGAPILPGVFVIEALFQAANAALGGGRALSEIVASRFHSPLLPGDRITARFVLKDVGAGVTRVEVAASGRVLAAELSMLLAQGEASPMVAAETPRWNPAGAPVRALDASHIGRALPHRSPMLLVDSALVADGPGVRPSLLARRLVRGDEPCFAASAPSRLGYPGMLVLESLGQSCGLLRAATGRAGESRDESKVPVVAKLAGVRFLGEVAPGEELEHHVELLVRTGDGAVFSGRTVVAGRPVIEVSRVVAVLAPSPLARDTFRA